MSNHGNDISASISGVRLSSDEKERSIMSTNNKLNFDADFLHNFILELDSFNKECENLEKVAEEKLAALRSSHDRNIEKLHEEQRGHVRSHVSSKKADVQRYESGLHTSDQQDKGQLQSLYVNMSKGKIAAALSGIGYQQQSANLLTTNKAQRQQNRDNLWTT